jgi:hypothetical protein
MMQPYAERGVAWSTPKRSKCRVLVGKLTALEMFSSTGQPYKKASRKPYILQRSFKKDGCRVPDRL